jgi:hypothetical protein
MPGKTDTKAGYFDKLKGLLDGRLITQAILRQGTNSYRVQIDLHRMLKNAHRLFPYQS